VCPGPPSHTTPARRWPFVYVIVFFTAGNEHFAKYPRLWPYYGAGRWVCGSCGVAGVHGSHHPATRVAFAGKYHFLHIFRLSKSGEAADREAEGPVLNGMFVTRQERDILPPSSSYRFPRNVTPHYDAVTP